MNPNFRALAIGSLLLIAACASDTTSPGDSPGTTTGEASVSVNPNNAPREGALVVHHDSDGEFVAQDTSDAEGNVTLELTAGDMVTIQTITPFNAKDAGSARNFVRVYTFVGVKPGDTLTLGREIETRELPDRDPEAVTLTGELPGHGVVSYSAGCEFQTSPIQFPLNLTVRNGCMTADEEFNVLLQTLVEGEKQQFAYAVDVPFSGSPPTPVDFTGRWRTDWQELTVQIPVPGITPRDVYASHVLRRGPNGFGTAGFYSWEGLSNPPEEETILLPRGFADALETEVVWSDFEGQWVEYYQIAPVDPNQSVLAIPQPPVTIDALPQFDLDGPDRPSLEWVVNRDGVERDAIMVSVDWQDETNRYSWSILLPPTADSFQFPELPAELGVVLPEGPTGSNRLLIAVVLTDESAVDGYDDHRNRRGFGPDFYQYSDAPGFRFRTGAVFDTGVLKHPLTRPADLE